MEGSQPGIAFGQAKNNEALLACLSLIVVSPAEDNHWDFLSLPSDL